MVFYIKYQLHFNLKAFRATLLYDKEMHNNKTTVNVVENYNESPKKALNITVLETDMAILNKYCDITLRSKADVVRELIRGLEKKVKLAEERKKRWQKNR